MRANLLFLALLLCQGCASTHGRETPDPVALQAVIEAAASGDAERAVQLADAATAKCAPGQDGVECSLSTRLLLANQFAKRESPALAASQAKLATEIAEASGDPFLRWPAWSLLATTAADAGRLDEAKAALERATSALDEVEQRAAPAERQVLQLARATLNGPQARVYLLEGEPGLAARSQAELVELIQRYKPGHPDLPVEVLNLADMYRSAGDTENALDALRLAVSLSAEQGRPDLENEALAAIEALSSPD